MAFECSYYKEAVDTTDLPKRFLEAFPSVFGIAELGGELPIPRQCELIVFAGHGRGD